MRLNARVRLLDQVRRRTGGSIATMSPDEVRQARISRLPAVHPLLEPLVQCAGDSAGGNLAALVAVAARDAGDIDLAGQVLIYPGTDLTTSFPSVAELSDAPLLTRADIDAFKAHYLGDTADPADPRVSPWFVEDLTGVAPALVQTAEHDPLRDEGTAYARRLEESGVPTRHTRYVGVPHGFVSLPGACPPAHQAAAEIIDFVRAR